MATENDNPIKCPQCKGKKGNLQGWINKGTDSEIVHIKCLNPKCKANLGIKKDGKYVIFE